MLELDHVSKRYRHGARQADVLREVTLQLHEREVIAVWGLPRSGRSALLRVAAGIEAPDSGVVRFRGRPLSVARSALPGGIAYCPPTFHGLEAQAVLRELIATQLARGLRHSRARERAFAALERAGVRGSEARLPYELERAEQVRVGIARALLQEPALLLIDDPTKGVDLLERDRILALLRSLSPEGVAVVMTLDNGVGLFAADRALSLGEGVLRGDVAPELAPVVGLPLRVSG
jgi:ABC-type ATPase involved in cell division